MVVAPPTHRIVVNVLSIRAFSVQGDVHRFPILAGTKLNIQGYGLAFNQLGTGPWASVASFKELLYCISSGTGSEPAYPMNPMKVSEWKCILVYRVQRLDSIGTDRQRTP